MPVQPQAAAGLRPQPIKTPPPAPAQAAGMEPASAQTRYAPPQPPRTPGASNRAVFKATNLSILPEQVKEGDPVTISVTVVNSGGAAGLYSVVFRINNVVESIAELSLGPGASQTTVCTVQKELEGEYYVDVEGLHGEFNVLKRAPASFQISNLTIKPEKVKQGQPISIGFMVTNTGEKPGIYNANLLIKGLTEASEDISVEPGETKSITFNVIKDAAGFFPVNVEGFSGRFVVEMDWKE